MNQTPLRTILKKYKILPRKNLGQHFIKDQRLLKRELAYANVNKRDIVLEIGPGVGNLTELLAQKAKKVIAIEKDLQFKDCLRDLQERHSNIELIWADALKVNFPRFNKVISNLPFKIALPITFKLLECNFKIGVLLYQKRLAARMCAKPCHKGYSRIGISLYRRAKLDILEVVPASTFYPQPNVVCALVEFVKIKPRFNVPSEEYFRKVLDFLFFPKNQSIKRALLSLRFKNSKKALDEILSQITPIQRKKVCQCTPKELGKIAELLDKYNIKIPKVSKELKRKVQKFKRTNS